MIDDNNGTWEKYDFSVADTKALRTIFAAERKQLLRNMLSGGIPNSERYGHKRAAKAIIRKGIVNTKRSRLIVGTNSSANKSRIRLKESHLLDILFPKRLTKWIPAARRSNKTASDIDIGPLNFHTHPSETMRQLQKLVKADSKCSSVRVNYRDQHCADVGPYLILSAMYKSLNRIFSGGKITQNLSRLFDALEIDKLLSMNINKKIDLPFDISAFKVRTGTGRSKKLSPTHLTDTQIIDKTNNELIAEINRWLGAYNEELSRPGRRVVRKLVGETLDNAERHSEAGLSKPDVGDWFLSGALVKFPASDIHRIHLAFLSVGNTISSSMDGCAKKTRNEMENYVNSHRHTMGKYGVEQLRTIFALQDGVTSRSDAFAQGRGGTGFQDICAFVQEMALVNDGKINAKFTIVSGHTVIHLKLPYLTGRKEQGDERELWFNSSNSSVEPPDKSHVSFTDFALGGTLLTMSFDMSPSLVEKENDKNVVS